MKRLSVKQIGPWCSFCCHEKRNRATCRENGFAKVFACDQHLQNLEDHEAKELEADARYTEADNDTWGRL